MKNLRTTMLCACMLVCCISTFAQNEVRVNEPDMNKPKLFASLPDNIIVNPERLSELLLSPVGAEVSFTLGDALSIQGRVISVANSESNVTSIVVRTTNYEGARLTFSRIIVEGVVTYAARMISMKHGDLYVLESKNGQYIFVKKNFYDLINE